jgi:hypothetical protein
MTNETKTDPRALDINASFQGVISISDHKPRCQRDLGGGRKCAREAVWGVDFHGCSGGRMCNECLEAWRTQAAQRFTGDGVGANSCTWCCRSFASLDDALTVVAL